MKSLTETYTPLIKNLHDLNLEIRQRLSSMPSCTEQEMKNLGKWLAEIVQMEKELDNISLVISHHLNLLQQEYKEQLIKNSLKD